jgi:branched-chain amino acid transport system permease protein
VTEHVDPAVETPADFPAEPTARQRRAEWLKSNRARISVLAVIVFLFLAALSGLEPSDWFATIMQGLSVGAITFLVASGLSLIFGLMDVLNLAHGELFMLGAYVAWTVYTRFDTVVDALVPLLLLGAAFALLPLWQQIGRRIGTTKVRRRIGGWGLLATGLVVLVVAVTKFPLVIWDAEDFARSPGNLSVQVDLGTLAPLPADSFAWPAVIAFALVLVGGAALALGLSTLGARSRELVRLTRKHLGGTVAVVVAAIVLYLVKGSLNEWVFGLSTTWRFFLAMVISVAAGAAVGALIEVVLIRPLYDRPIYQLMLTLGVGFILIELVREVWGRPEFTMARPAAFDGTGEGCPGQGLGGFFSGCSTVEVFGSRLRVYNEGFVVLVGVVVLVGITMLLKRTRIGMIIRAGVQDPEMVEALGINVRRVFTLVFAIGSGLAALGGVLAAPSIGLGSGMGAVFLLAAIVALAIGGLDSFPGAAAGALLVGLLQQIIIRFGQTGINLPFVAEPFKPSPTLVPAASILLMVIILLVLPTGLFGRSEK